MGKNKSKSLRQLLMTVFIYIGFYYVFMNAAPDWRPYYTTVWPVIAFGSFMLNIGRIHDLASHTKVSTSIIEYTLYFLVTIMSMLITGYLGKGWERIQKLFLGIIFAIAVASDEDQYDDVINAVAIFSIMMLAVSIMQLVAPEQYRSMILPKLTLSEEASFQVNLKHNFVIGLTNSISQNGLFMTIGFVVYAVKFVTTEKRFFKIMSGILAIMFFAMIFATGKRSYSLTVILLVIAIMNLQMANRKVFQRTMLVLVIVAILALAFYIAAQKISFLNNTFQRITTFMDEGDVTNGRNSLYTRAFNAIKEHPFFGIGASRTGAVVGGALHNEYLQYLLEYGFVLVWVPLLTVLHPFIICLKYLKNHIINYKNKDGEHFLMAFLFMMMILISAFFALPFQAEKTFMMFTIFQMIALKKISPPVMKQRS